MLSKFSDWLNAWAKGWLTLTVFTVFIIFMVFTLQGAKAGLDMHFFYEYGQNNRTFLGEIWGKTITAFLQNFSIDWNDKSSNGHALIVKNAQQWLLIGDPSLKIGGYQQPSKKI